MPPDSPTTNNGGPEEIFHKTVLTHNAQYINAGKLNKQHVATMQDRVNKNCKGTSAVKKIGMDWVQSKHMENPVEGI